AGVSAVSSCTTTALDPFEPESTTIVPVLPSSMGTSGRLAKPVMVSAPRQGGNPLEHDPAVLPTSLMKLTLPLSSPTTTLPVVGSKTGLDSLWPLFTGTDQAAAGVPVNTPVIFHSTP